MSRLTLVWLRGDLRFADHQALTAASKKEGGLLGVYVYHPRMVGVRRWWLHQSLRCFTEQAKKRGLPLILLKGNPETLLPKLMDQLDVHSIYWNCAYEPADLQIEERLRRRLAQREVRTFPGNVLAMPGELLSQKGEMLRLFHPFWTRLQKHAVTKPLPEPTFKVQAAPRTAGLELDELKLLSKETLHFEAHWQPGEAAARRGLSRFLETRLASYGNRRDQLDAQDTSRLSPHLHFGELSVREVWHRVQEMRLPQAARDSFLRELCWREFAIHTLFHRPDLCEENYRKEFDRFPWHWEGEEIERWKEGQTGYPLVDAGMRELLATGWIHNRVRMVVASFLTKHLLVHWRVGADHFMERLVDADLAINSMNWQWVAGCGVDPAPFFRIFNPVLQGKKYDPSGQYVRSQIPNLESVSTRYIHTPWLDPAHPAPPPIVDHEQARKRALEAHKSIRKRSVRR